MSVLIIEGRSNKILLLKGFSFKDIHFVAIIT
jgi:hypothetical protein